MSFANGNTILPSTIEDEVCIFFDDRDVGQGGFTIGSAMQGVGDATKRLDDSVIGTGYLNRQKTWRGNRWNGVYAPDQYTDVTLEKIGSDTLLPEPGLAIRNINDDIAQGWTTNNDKPNYRKSLKQNKEKTKEATN